MHIIIISKDGPFVWDKSMQGMMLGSFFWGYVLTQIPGGILAERFGPKIVFLICMGTVGIASVLVPVAAQVHPYMLMALRVIQGLAQVSIQIKSFKHRHSKLPYRE